MESIIRKFELIRAFTKAITIYMYHKNRTLFNLIITILDVGFK